MKLPISEARALACKVLARNGFEADHAEIIADHLVYNATKWEGPLWRALSIIDEQRRQERTPITVTDRTRFSAVIDGGGTTGYLTSALAIDKAMDLARANGIGLVGMHNCWWSGALAYYVERAARAGFVAFHVTNAKARVAPAGGIDPLLGTNPIAFAFPCDPDPLVLDIGTSAYLATPVMRAADMGGTLPEGVAVDADGASTTDPAEVLKGAILPWGGARGYAMALAVQALGMLGGGSPVVSNVTESGFFFLVMDPEALMPAEEYKAGIAELIHRLENSRPMPGVDRVRVPGSNSAAVRRQAHAEDVEIEVNDKVYARILALLDGATA